MVIDIIEVEEQRDRTYDVLICYDGCLNLTYLIEIDMIK